MGKTGKHAQKTKEKSKQFILKKKRCCYKKENLNLAVEEALKGISVAEVSRKYQVPESTIRAKKIGKYANKRPGPSTILSADEEKELENWIFVCTDRGFPVTKHQLVESVKLLCDSDKRKTPFKSNRPGRSWYEAFLKRHPNISQRITENVSLSRAKVSEFHIRSWFSEISTYLTENNLISIDSTRVFNGDEVGVSMNPKPPTVLAPKGCKNVYNIVNNNEKENVTVLVIANAAGTLAPTLVLFAGQSLPKDVMKVAPDNYSFGYSENGWMTSKNFYEYIANVFYPWLESSGIELPIILYIDGHSSHITLPLSEFCHEKQIILIALYPNSTHILQPLDVSLFRTFKMAWQKSFQSFCQKFGTISIKKCQVAPLLEKTFKSLDLKNILQNGFKACGLCPLDVNAVDFKKVFKQIESLPCETTNNLEDAAEVIKKSESLKVLESLIDTDKLQLFNTHKSMTWTGQKEDQSLFEIWYMLAKSKDKQISNSNEVSCKYWILRCVHNSTNI